MIGGTVTVNGIQLTQDSDTGYDFKVTDQSGVPYKDYSGNPSQGTDGLNNLKYYIIKIPLYDTTDQPEGAHPGDTALVSVYKDGQKLTETDSPRGFLQCRTRVV
jgi:hypothetical protein